MAYTFREYTSTAYVIDPVFRRKDLYNQQIKHPTQGAFSFI